MYAKLCSIEVLPGYIKEVAVGDILTVQALITNPLDWHHFYEKVSTIKIGDKTDFTVITKEGERVIGSGNVVEVDKWSNRGHYGFKIKISVKKQKSLTDRRIRGPNKVKPSAVQSENVSDVTGHTSVIVPPAHSLIAAAPLRPATSTITTTDVITVDDINSFKEMLKESLTMDITS